MAEQLVEVPTVLSPSVLQQRFAEQIVDNPVPCGDLHVPLSAHGASSAVSRDEAFFTRFFPWEKCGGRWEFACEGARALERVDAGGS